MNNILRAALWMVGAIIAFTSMAIAGRAVSLELNTFEIMLYRSITGVIIVLTMGKLAGTLGQINRSKLKLHFVRNACHFIGQNLWFYALAIIPLAQVFALEFTTPIWVILLSPIILQERLTAIGLISATLGFIGILIVARPDLTTLDPGIIAGAASAIFFALTAIFTRKLTQTESITNIMFFLTLLQAAFGLICAIIYGGGQISLPSASAWPWVIIIGITGLAAHFCLTQALSIAPASVVMPIDFIRLPTIAVVAMILYDEPLDVLVFVGAALIFAANYLNITQGQRV